ncbi:ABC transporter substrate binding protein [Cognatishimia sp. SS12]|uniref:ABC transporter substrate binding protein n=1 Tax=Cognatishimia sp. SS12 TaxID=2979465 RepID=UPI00232BAB22|nr:ABC transporter substrate binding protein [Cognatishimia sp. SS12]MDC0739347.1 ABC transporter substrate binding protein [Cognatishimia sp. SS12]
MKRHKIGLLHYVHENDPFFDTSAVQRVRQTLARYGYHDGENVTFHEAYGGRDFERTVALAQAMVDAGVDVICSFISNANKAAKIATETTQTPVVCWSSYPLQEGLAESYLQPGGNFTGFTYDPYHNLAKVRALKIADPTLSDIGYFYDPTYGPARHALPEIAQAAELLGLTLHHGKVAAEAEILPTLETLIAGGARGIVVGPHEMLNRNGKAIGACLLSHGIPASCNQMSILQAGALVRVSNPAAKGWDSVAGMIDQILQGTPVASLPFDRGLKAPMELNLTNAAKLNLSLPAYFINEADRVIGAPLP